MRVPKLFDRLLDTCGVISGYLCGLIAIFVTLDVTLRVLGTGGINWVFDLVEYVLFGLTVIGASYVLRERAHVVVDLVSGGLPESWQRPFRMLSLGLSIVICSGFLFASTLATINVWQSGSMIFKTFVVPEWLPLSLVPIMFLLLTIELFRQFLQLLRHTDGSETVTRSDAL